MPRPRFHKLPKEKQERILDAALSEFAHHGFEDASYNRIIDAAGISKGAMYYYFDDKADLYVTLLARIGEEKMTIFQNLEFSEDTPYWKIVEETTRVLMDWAESRPEYFMLAKGYLRLKPGALGDNMERLMGQWREAMAAFLELGQRKGAVRSDLDIKLLVGLVLAVGEAFDRWWLAHEDPPPKAAIISTVMGLFRRLLEPKGSSKDEE